MKNKKTIVVTLVMVLMFPFYVAGILSFASRADAFVGVFGGKIQGVIQCTCSGGHVIIVGPPRPGRFKFTSGSKLFEYRQIKKVGAWVLGTYNPPSPCKKKIGKKCITIPHQGNIELVGTSL